MTPKRRNRLRAALLAVAVAFVVAGVWRGEVRTVFIKAANICLECIGLG